MEVIETKISGVIEVRPDVFGDERGFFMESWNKERYSQIGISEDFVQDNVSFSKKGILRGLHYQHPEAQGKLVSVLEGEVFDVAVDIRLGSPTFGQWVGITLSSKSKNQFYIPPGLAHGFEVLSDAALFAYKCTQLYKPQNETTLMWNDPGIGIKWNTKAPLLSQKDKQGLNLAQIPQEKLPSF